jgi:DNA-binding NarL/FixJ family response regulator
MASAVELAFENWLHGLTPREYQVAVLVSRGMSNKEVARELGVSDGTVKLHVHNIFQKLGARNRYGLIQRMVSSGSTEVVECGRERPVAIPDRNETHDR